MKITPLTSYASVAAVISLPTAFAWGAAGHEIVATIAQIHLHPTVLSKVCNILYPDYLSNPSRPTNEDVDPPCYISRVATWADQVRRQAKYRHTASWHYIGAVDDHPPNQCAFPGERGWAGRTDVNVFGAIRNMTGILEGYVLGDVEPSQAEEALKFLIHFVGDMHMPLHLTGRDRGGNGAKVAFDDRVTNLHSLWDSLLIAQSLRTIPRNYTRALPAGKTVLDIESHLRGTIYDSYIRRLMYEGFGNEVVLGRFSVEYVDWLSCPPRTGSGVVHTWDAMQSMLGVKSTTKDEERWDDESLCPYSWGKQLHSLNCELPVWPRELDQPPYNHLAYSSSNADSDADHDHGDELPLDDLLERPRHRPPRHPDLLELDTPEYAGRIRSEWVTERLMAMAGLRLAGILNGLFLDGGVFRNASDTLPVLLGLRASD